MNITDYEWDPFADHAWLASDKNDKVALFTCCVEQALPSWVHVPSYLIYGLRERIIKDIPSFTEMNTEFVKTLSRMASDFSVEYVKYVHLVAQKGLFLFDFPVNSRNAVAYECVTMPNDFLLVNMLPNDLKLLATQFRIYNVDFLSKKIALSDLKQIK